MDAWYQVLSKLEIGTRVQIHREADRAYFIGIFDGVYKDESKALVVLKDVTIRVIRNGNIVDDKKSFLSFNIDWIRTVAVDSNLPLPDEEEDKRILDLGGE